MFWGINMNGKNITAKPDWLKVRYNEKSVAEVSLLMDKLSLNTVCKEANCPNLGECYKKTHSYIYDKWVISAQEIVSSAM